jgi:hypothetical protein
MNPTEPPPRHSNAPPTRANRRADATDDSELDGGTNHPRGASWLSEAAMCAHIRLRPTDRPGPRRATWLPSATCTRSMLGAHGRRLPCVAVVRGLSCLEATATTANPHERRSPCRPVLSAVEPHDRWAPLGGPPPRRRVISRADATAGAAGSSQSKRVWRSTQCTRRTT